MLLTVRKIADALEVGDNDGARLLYHDEYLSGFDAALRIARSNTVELEKNLSGMLFRLSVAK